MRWEVRDAHDDPTTAIPANRRFTSEFDARFAAFILNDDDQR
jgi:hypothetical protein